MTANEVMARAVSIVGNSIVNARSVCLNVPDMLPRPKVAFDNNRCRVCVR